jgi:16S rRNA processing protein RimM
MEAGMPDDRSPPSMVAAPTLLRVAYVRRVHGVRGEVRVQVLGGDVERFAPGTQLVSEREHRSLSVASSRPLGGGEVLLAFDGVGSRDAAAALSGDYLCVDPAHARSLGTDEWFVWQLVGLRAVSEDGEELGVVRDVEATPASDVIVVADGARERRYPMVRAWVRSIDVPGGVIVVTPWPEDDS